MEEKKWLKEKTRSEVNDKHDSFDVRVKRFLLNSPATGDSSHTKGAIASPVMQKSTDLVECFSKCNNSITLNFGSFRREGRDLKFDK
jgi:hypothetical protein